MTSLFGIRNVAELIGGISRQTVANYMELLEQANLIYRSDPAELSGKKVLKARSKIYLADAAIRNAVLMIGEEILTDAAEMGMVIETTVYKHINAFYYEQLPQVGYYREPRTEKEVDIVVSFPRFRIIIEVKYRENTTISEKEAIVEWANDEKTLGAIVITKNSDDYGFVSHPTRTKIVKIPAFAFLYLLGHAEYEGYIGNNKKET
jgi:predicted AAA+ superfamily ATPase